MIQKVADFPEKIMLQVQYLERDLAAKPPTLLRIAL
jgi:hypothetical protein